MRRTSTWALHLTLLALWVPAETQAADGVLEVNQTCAAGAGCFAGDSAGYPVQIVGGGSYRLTSNLTAPNQNTTLILVSGAGVRIDLNGFTLQGTNVFSGPGGSCSAAGTGSGIGASANDLVVSDGSIVGMGNHGIDMGTGSSGDRVERVTVMDSCGIGIRVPLSSLVSRSIARKNGSHGIVANSGSRVVDSITDVNGGTGIRMSETGDMTVEGCVAVSNGQYGILAGARSLVRGNLAATNVIHGIGALGRSEVIENASNRNLDRGISMLGSLASSDATAMGLNVAMLNGTLNFSGGVLIGCNMQQGLVKTCP